MAGGGRPVGRADNPYLKRKRVETEEAKNARIQRSADTRKKNTAAKAAAEAKKKAEAKKAAQSFFQPRHTTTDPAEATPFQVAPEKETDDADDDIATNEAVEVIPALNVNTNLDIDDEDVDNEVVNDSTDDNEPCLQRGENKGVQQEYVKAIQMRLRDEVNTQSMKCKDKWLLRHLSGNGWWIRKENARFIASKLNLQKSYSAYYRDVYVWLPDIQWNDDTNCMPCCPSCKSNEHVGNNGFRDNHFGRLIVGLRENYYVISRRYICYSCQRKSKEADAAINQAFDGNADVSVEQTVNKIQYSFMGWNNESLSRFPLGRGSQFPAYLTWKAGVDKTVVDMMRPLFDKGFKPESFSNMLLELHTSEFAMKSLRHEYEVKRQKNQRSINTESSPSERYAPLGNFADKLKNRGIVPTGRYLIHVYKSFHETIRPYLEQEVKKRDMDVLMWDVSYKEAKALYQYRGKSVFRGLVTGLNQYGEVRLQFHIYTDSHDQMLCALKEFEKTRTMLGFNGISHIIGDNPKKETSLFMNTMPSIKAQQDKYDSQKVSSGRDPSSGLLYYNPKDLIIKVVHGMGEIGRVVDAMKEEMKGNTVGLDAEWNRILNERGRQIQRGKIQWIQLAYRNRDEEIRVHLLWVGNLTKLPDSLTNLLCDDSIVFAGNRVSADLKYIGHDFKIEPMMAVDQKRRENVINLAKYAHVRGVSKSATVGLDELSELTLEVAIDKSLQTSHWSKDLSEDQKQYAAIDAAASLEVYEVLEKMKDLSCRLREDDAKIGTTVDIVPSNGSPISMATRSATGTIVGRSEYVCPVGYTYNNKRRVRIGKRAYVVKISHLHAPGLIIPRYKYKNTSTKVTLGDLGTIEVIVPLDMLADHVECARQLQLDIGNTDMNTVSAETDSNVRRSERGQIPRVRLPIDGYETDTDEEDVEEQLSCGEALEEAIDEFMIDLTSDDVGLLRAAVFEAQETMNGKVPLKCDGLEDAPRPELIEDKFSAVLGDVFHAMDRAKVPVKHEAKKAYFVALREAFFIWNPAKLAELEKNMRDAGLTEEEIKQKRYFNARLYRECVERTVPSPKILYWRVRAVFALYGRMIDSKTKTPLFTKAAWKKANNVLKDILAGYYSDPPDLNFYTKKLGKNGEIVSNQYGLEVIECFRGTNRTESYHKNLAVTFGSWHVGIELSDCLLAERRHRHNQKCSERRRLGFPVLGHYNTWIVDQLQNLVKENHGIQMYPYWTNASDYKQTSETFDTIPLQHTSLHEKLQQRCQEIGPVKLTREQLYMNKAMNTLLPFLPFVSKEESMAYAKYVLDREEGRDFDVAAEDFLRYVDGVNVMPKLPSHMSTYDETWSRNKRIQENEKRSKDGREKLNELNKMLAPHAGDGCDQQPQLPQPLPECPVQAVKTSQCQIVGGIFVGKNPLDNAVKRTKKTYHCGVCGNAGCPGVGKNSLCPVRKAQVATQSGAQSVRVYHRRCKVCMDYGAPWMNCVSGGSKRVHCRNFMINGDLKCQRCVKYTREKSNNCVVGGVNEMECKYFERDGTKKYNHDF